MAKTPTDIAEATIILNLKWGEECVGYSIEQKSDGGDGKLNDSVWGSH